MMKTLTIASEDTGLLSKQDAPGLKPASYHLSNHSADPSEDDNMESYWTEESFYDASLISGCAIEETVDGENDNHQDRRRPETAALNESCATNEYEEVTLDDDQSYEESVKFESSSAAGKKSKTPGSRKPRKINHIHLQRTQSAATDIAIFHESGLTTEGDVSLMIVEGGGSTNDGDDDEYTYEERTVEESFIGSSGDYMELEVTETEEEPTESETPEDDDINDTTDGESTAFSLRLPAPSAHGHRNYDSVSTISFAFDDLSSRSSLTENDFAYVTVEGGADLGASIMTRDSMLSVQTSTSSSMDDIQSTVPGNRLSFSMHTQATTASTIISNAPTAVMGNFPLEPTDDKEELEKSNTIISNITRNINSNRKKDGKHMDISRTYLAPLQGEQRLAITRTNSWGATNQRRRERRGGTKKNAPRRRKSSDDAELELSDHETNNTKQTFRQDSKIIRSPRSMKRAQQVHVMSGSDRSIISQSQCGGSRLSGSEESIISRTLSQRIDQFGVLTKGESESTINSQALTLSGSDRTDGASKSTSSDGLSRSGSGTRLSRSGSGTRLSGSGSDGNSRSRSGSAGRMPRSNSGNRLDHMPNASNPTPRRMLTRGGSARFIGDEPNRSISANADGGRRIVAMERAHLAQMAIGSNNRRMMARANSAKKLVLDDHRQTGSHSRTGIFKIEESKDLLFAKSMH